MATTTGAAAMNGKVCEHGIWRDECDQSHDPAPRTYVVGLPVIITVHDDGKVSYEIDTAEAAQAIREGFDEGEVETDSTEAQTYDDATLVDADHMRRHPEVYDLAGSASRQHFIDTGLYLSHVEVAQYATDLDAHRTDDERFGAQEA